MVSTRTIFKNGFTLKFEGQLFWVLSGSNGDTKGHKGTQKEGFDIKLAS